MQYWWREVVEAYSLEPHHLRHISARIFGHSTIIEGVARVPDPIADASSWRTPPSQPPARWLR
jgi:hypothetical protein